MFTHHTEVGVASPKCLEIEFNFWSPKLGKIMESSSCFVVDLTFWESFGLCRVELGAQQC